MVYVDYVDHRISKLLIPGDSKWFNSVPGHHISKQLALLFARRKRTDAERAALKEAASRLQLALAAEGISEEEILKDFKRWRRAEHK